MMMKWKTGKWINERKDYTYLEKEKDIYTVRHEWMDGRQDKLGKHLLNDTLSAFSGQPVLCIFVMTSLPVPSYR